MGSRYDRALSRLRAKRVENPDYSAYRQTMQSLAEPVKSLNRSTQGSMMMAGGSIGAMGQQSLNSQGMLQDMSAQEWGKADRSATARNDALDSRIGQLEDARDQENDAKKDGVLKTAIQLGGTALGAAVGTIVAPGAGTLAGAQIGAGLGQAAGSFVGGGGDYGLSHLSSEELISGVGEAAMATASVLTLKGQKALAKDMGDFIKANSANTDVLEGLKLALVVGEDAARQYIKKPEVVLGTVETNLDTGVVPGSSATGLIKGANENLKKELSTTLPTTEETKPADSPANTDLTTIQSRINEIINNQGGWSGEYADELNQLIQQRKTLRGY